MPTEPPSTATPASAPERAARGRARRVAAGFLFVFALSVGKVVSTGFWVRSPARTAVPPPQQTPRAGVESARAARVHVEPERRAEAATERELRPGRPAALDQ